MSNLIFRFFIMVALASMMACESDSTDSGSTSINVTTSSGAAVALTGSYDTACYIQNGLGFKENITFSGADWIYTTSTYADSTCSGTSTDIAIIATINVVADQQIAAWVNGNGDTVAAPAGTAGSSFTALNLTITSSDDIDISVGMQVAMGYVVDDSDAAGLTLYRMDDVVNSIATIADPFTDIVISTQQSLIVTTATGGTAVLEGTFTEACYASDYDNDAVEDGNMSIWVISGNTLTAESIYYPSDTSCTGSPVVFETVIGNLTAGADANLGAWMDAFAAPASPPASAGNAAVLLAETPPYTTITLDIVSIDGVAPTNATPVVFSFVVDESHASGLTIYHTNFDSVAGQASVDDPRKNY